MRLLRCLFLVPLTGLPLAAIAQSGPSGRTPAGTAAPSPATADDSAYDPDEIVVRGAKPRGSVVGDIAPEETLGPADIRSYGVNNISDLLDELAPQTQSDRGRGGGAPVVLLNGRRISGFGEIRDLPTEAIQRVEILPEEVSLKYGYSADQRVVNIVLRRRFRALVGQAGGATSTDGGGSSTNPEGNLVRIHGDQRFTVNLRFQDQARLLESQRDIASPTAGQPFDLRGNIAALRGATSTEIDPALSALAGGAVTVAGVPASSTPTLADFAATANRANVTDLAPYRTLQAASRTYSTNIVYARPFVARSTLTFNGSLSYASTDGLQGLPGAALTLPAGNPFSPFADDVGLYRYLDTDPLHQRVDTLTAHVGVGMNGDRGHWRYSLTGSFDRTDTSTRTETGLDASGLQAALSADDAGVNPFGAFPPGLIGGTLRNRVSSVTNSGALTLVAGGPLFSLPAGPVGSNLKLGFEDDRFDGSSTRAGLFQSSDLGRRNVNGQVNIDVPIASAKENVLAPLGLLSANANLAVRQLSDFGTLHTIGYGLHWVPIKPIDLIASVTDDQGAPTVQQLGAPPVVTPQVRVFDYLAGTTVDVTQLSGGNRNLRADNRRVMKLGLTLKPFAKNDFTAIVNYLDTRTRNAIASLPEPTADIERAFPDRFVRDEDGTLIRTDASPVNFQREQQNEVRYGFNVSISLKSVMQRRFEAWLADRRAGKDTPPPFPLPDRMRRRAEQSGEKQANGAPPPPPDGDAPPPPPPGGGDGPPPGGPSGLGGFGGPGGGGPGGFGGGGFGRGGGRGGRGAQAGGRLQIALYDTWTLKDTVLVRDGVPVIDLLHGGSVTSGGGQPEHKVQLQLGYANNGLGVRLSGNYQTATRVDAGVGSATGDLRFSGLATASLRLFADLGQIPSLVKKGWARGARVTLELNNIANARQRVRDANGDTPLRYQPAYLDPLGRTVRITFRKLLF